MRALLRSVLFLAAAIPAAARGNIPDPSFAETRVLSAMISEATTIARPPDGTDRLFIGLKDGTVRVLENGALRPGSFWDFSPIYTGSECGLLGIAFDPEYMTNRYVYFFVTVSGNEQQIIRLTDDSNSGIDILPVVTDLATIGANHDGGGIGFGPDGMLYWSIGDNGAGRGVDGNLSSLASKVGRAHPDGSVPNDNPFFDGAGPNNDYIWARGLRNPFTLTFEPSRGRLWINVVGSNYEQIFVVARGDHAGYNDYENNQPAGYITPVIKYRTNGLDSEDIVQNNGAVRAAGLLTVTTGMRHGFRKGERITLSGIADSSMNGAVFVAEATSNTTFTALQAGADASSGGGSATTLSMGGCITGGTFYDGSDFGAEFEDNFFFGDYNDGLIMRATLDASGQVSTLDHFGTQFSSPTDIEGGADGALYVLEHGGTLERLSWVHDADKLVVSNRHLSVVEGSRAGFAVRLAREPASDVTVSISRSAGDGSVEVFAGSQLTFTPANWAEPHAVEIAALLDFDSDADLATISVEAPGMAPEQIEVTTRDVNRQTIMLSETMLTVAEGNTTGFDISLSNPPEGQVMVTVSTETTELVIDGGGPRVLLFDETNYAVVQSVMMTSLEDDDADNETHQILVNTPGAASREVEVLVRDNERTPPSMTSVPPAMGIVGVEVRYDVEASGFPVPTFSLDVFPAGAVFSRDTGVLVWIPRSAGAASFTVRAANGVEPDAVQTFVVEVVADAAPTVRVRAPLEGATITGATVDFSAEATDDVGAVRAEFFVDGLSVYADERAASTFYFGGEPNRFDTTSMVDGAHRLKVTVSDARGQKASAEIGVTVANDVEEEPMINPPKETEEGCGCSSTQSRAPGGGLALLFAAVVLFRNRGTLLRVLGSHAK